MSPVKDEEEAREFRIKLRGKDTEVSIFANQICRPKSDYPYFKLTLNGQTIAEYAAEDVVGWRSD